MSFKSAFKTENFDSPIWVNSAIRKPILWKTYYVFLGGKKAVYTMADLISYEKNYADAPYLWLDMQDVETVQVYLHAVTKKKSKK